MNRRTQADKAALSLNRSRRKALSVCVRLLLPFALAAYLLFWFFEGLGSTRIDAIAAWSTENNILTRRITGGEIYSPGTVISTSIARMRP